MRKRSDPNILPRRRVPASHDLDRWVKTEPLEFDGFTYRRFRPAEICGPYVGHATRIRTRQSDLYYRVAPLKLA